MARDASAVAGAIDYNNGPPEVGREVGTAFTRWDAMFTQWNDGRVLAIDEWEAKDINDMLKKEGKAQAIENVLTLPLNQLEWKITPSKGDTGESDWLSEWLDTPDNQGGMSTPLDTVIGQMTSAISHKRSYFEKVFKVSNDGTKWVYDKVAWRPQTTCTMVRDPKTAGFGGFAQEPVTKAMQEKNGMLPIKIEPKYAYVYFHKANRDPINGMSDLEVPYWCYKTKQKVLFLFFNFLEGQALPRTIVEASDLGRATQIAGQVAKMKNSGVLPIANTSGANQKVYTLDVAGHASSHFMEAINYLEHVASVGQLAGFVDLAGVGVGSGRGSMALSQDQSDFFLQSRQAIAKEMAGSLRHWLLADLIYYNFGTDAAVPQFEFGPLAEANKAGALSLLQSIIAQPKLSVPDEFVHQLAMSVSGVLNLDTDAIDSAFADASFKAQREAANAGAPPLIAGAAGLGAPVNAATTLAKQTQAGKPPTTKQAVRTAKNAKAAA